jgi:DME family drug/metabolite transporter
MEFSVSRGEAYALACGFLWAVNSLILRTQALQLQPRLINMIRCGAAGVLLCLALPLGGPVANLLQVPLVEWGLLFGSLLFGVVLGDTGYIGALKEVGVSRTMPIAGTYPLATLLFEWVLFDHAGGLALLVGSGLVVTGVVCMSSRPAVGGEHPTRFKVGVALALGAALCWGLSCALLKPASAHMSGIHANAVRMPLVVLILFLSIALPSGLDSMRKLKPKTVLIVAASGAVSMGLVGILFVEALKDGSATKIVTLTSTSPLFALIMAVIFLKEKLNTRVLVGSVLCLSGVFVVL